MIYPARIDGEPHFHSTERIRELPMGGLLYLVEESNVFVSGKAVQISVDPMRTWHRILENVSTRVQEPRTNVTSGNSYNAFRRMR